MTQERRKHKRFPVIRNLAKPVELVFENLPAATSVPAVLLDLSAGGIGLLSFVPVETGTKIIVHIDLEGLSIGPTEGKVIWTLVKGESWRLGIAFAKIGKSDFDAINSVARDYHKCKIRLSSGKKSLCLKKCLYQSFCSKPAKLAKKRNRK